MTTNTATFPFEDRQGTPCVKCGTLAKLVRVVPDSFTRGRLEIWVYECTNCGAKIEDIIEKQM